MNLLETNIRQRGDIGGSAKKVGKRLDELKRIYGIKHGGAGYYGNQYKDFPNKSETPITQEQIASMNGMSVDTLQNYDDATIIDVMEWMINTQLGRRNLPPQQRIAVVKRFEKKIQEQAKHNMSIGGSSDKKGSPNGETLIEKKIRTDKELAKLAGVE